MNADPKVLDAIVNRLANVQPFNIHAIDETKDSHQPWYQVTGAIAKELVISEAMIEEQVQSISAQIQHWGRLEAQARRVWQMVDRKYRIWRDGLKVRMLTPDGSKDWKKPTEAALDASARADPEYPKWYAEIERAEEAFNATHAVLEGWRCKQDMLKIAVWRRKEDSAARQG